MKSVKGGQWVTKSEQINNKRGTEERAKGRRKRKEEEERYRGR